MYFKGLIVGQVSLSLAHESCYTCPIGLQQCRQVNDISHYLHSKSSFVICVRETVSLFLVLLLQRAVTYLSSHVVLDDLSTLLTCQKLSLRQIAWSRLVHIKAKVIFMWVATVRDVDTPQ